MKHEIASLKDEKIQLDKSLNSVNGRIESGKFLIEGIEAIEWALESVVIIDYILSVKQVKRHRQILFKY